MRKIIILLAFLLNMMPFIDFEEKTISITGNKVAAQSMGDEGICNVLCPTTIVTLPCELATTVNCDPVIVTPGPDPYYPPDPYQPPPNYAPCDPANPAYNPCNCGQCGPPPGSGGSSGSGSGGSNGGTGGGSGGGTTAPCGAVSCSADAYLNESTCSCVLGPKPCENPGEIRDSDGNCVPRTKDNPCTTQGKFRSTFTNANVTTAYNGLKALQSQSSEWGHTLYADISNGLTYTASANTTSGLETGWEDFTLETQMTAFTIGQEHTHPAGTNDNPSPIDIVSLARMVLFMQEEARGLNPGEKYIVQNFNMGVSIGSTYTWSYHIPNNAAAQQIVDTYNNTYEGSNAKMEEEYDKLRDEFYSGSAILYKMFGVNNIDLMKAKKSSPGSSEYQVISQNGKSTGKADCP